MKRPPVYTIVIVGLPLLLIAGYVLLGSGQTASSDFVHPPLPSDATEVPGTGNVTPSGDNVTDAYFHQVFILRERMRSNPEDTLAMRQLGRLFQDGHRMSSADSAYTAYLARRPRARQVWLDLAAARAGDKRWDDAEDAINDMLKEYPGDPSAYYNLGAIAANQGDFARARSMWEQTVNSADDSAVVRMARNALARLDIP